MQEKDAGQAAAKYGWVHLALLGMGYGLYLSYFPIGPLGTVFLTQLAGTWDNILLARVLFEFATVGVILAWRRKNSARIGAHKATIRASFALAIAVVALVPVLAPTEVQRVSEWVAFALWLALGVLTSTPKLLWYESFLDLYSTQGRSRFLVCLALCFFIPGAVTPLSSLMADTPQAATVIMATLALSWACSELQSKVPGKNAQNTQPQLATAYRSSNYMKLVTASFGASWAFSYTVAVGSGFGTSGLSSPSSGVMLAGIALCSALMLAFSRSGKANDLRFNEMLRWTIVAVASIWAAMPLVFDALPWLACFLCSAAYIFQSALMILLIVEICDDYRVRVSAVTASHYGRFIAFAGVSSVIFYVLSNWLEPRVVIEAVAAICVVVTVACVPILPSRKSRAAVLAMDALPEETSREDLLRDAMARLAQSRGLTPREAQVMEMLVGGASRADMACALSVSAWTVKNHVGSIYAKTGVHSCAELVSLLEQSGTGR